MVKYNGEFKLIDTEEKAYFLGLMYSDGSIWKSDPTQGSYCIKLKFMKDDESLIEQLIDIFPFFRLFEESQYYTYKGVTQKKFYTGMRIYCEELLEDFEALGLLVAKSTWNKNNLKMPKISNLLMPHFIRGLADGDGSYSWCVTDGKKYMNVVIIDASKPFMEELCVWMNANGLKCKITLDKTYYRIRFRKHSDVMLYKSLIIDNASIYMSRKYNKLINYSGPISAT
jgi:hypothetical protein